jgi:hypothetical protein
MEGAFAAVKAVSYSPAPMQGLHVRAQEPEIPRKGPDLDWETISDEESWDDDDLWVAGAFRRFANERMKVLFICLFLQVNGVLGGGMPSPMSAIEHTAHVRAMHIAAAIFGAAIAANETRRNRAILAVYIVGCIVGFATIYSGWSPRDWIWIFGSFLLASWVYLVDNGVIPYYAGYATKWLYLTVPLYFVFANIMIGMVFGMPVVYATSEALEQSLVFSQYSAAIGWFVIYVMISVCLWNVAQLLKMLLRLPEVLKRLWEEYLTIKTGLLEEYDVIKTGLTTEYKKKAREIKDLAMFQMLSGFIVPTFVFLTGFLFSFIKLLFPAQERFHPQGWKGDVNRGGTALGGLISICMLLLAPLMGAKKIVGYLRPILDLIRNLPYATWMCGWLFDWLEGKADWDDLPQDSSDLRDTMKTAKEAEDLDDALADVRETTERLNRGNKKKGETTSLFQNFKAWFTNDKEERKLKKPKSKDQSEQMASLSAEQAEQAEKRKERDKNINGCYLFVVHKDNAYVVQQKKNVTNVKNYHDMLTVVGEMAADMGEGQNICLDWKYFFYSFVEFQEHMDELHFDEYSEEFFVGEEPEKGARELEQQGKEPSDAESIIRNRILHNVGRTRQKAPMYDRFLRKVTGWYFDLFSSDYIKDGESDETSTERRGMFVQDNSRRLKRFISDSKKYVAMTLVVVLALSVAYVKSGTEEVKELKANPQGKKARVLRKRRRAGKKFIVPSSVEVSEADYSDADGYEDAGDESYWEREGDFEYNMKQQRDEQTDEDMRTYWRKQQIRDRLLDKQAKTQSVVTMKPDDDLRRAVYKAKRRTIRAPVAAVNKFVGDAKEAFSKLRNLKVQSFQPSELACGVYKLMVNGHYACTATHVSNRLYVVLHCLSEDPLAEYKAVNHVHTIKLDFSQIVIVNKEIAYFPVNGIASPFKSKSFKVLEDAAIVTVLGYGAGSSLQPDAIVGFASPLGWCNAATRNGDCTAPVLDANGKIVGFWTHGNGRDFGRFERITPEFIKGLADSSDVVFHTGLLFQPSPPSPQTL